MAQDEEIHANLRSPSKIACGLVPSGVQISPPALAYLITLSHILLSEIMVLPILVFGVDVPIAEFLIIMQFFSILCLGIGIFQLMLINLKLRREVNELSEAVYRIRKAL